MKRKIDFSKLKLPIDKDEWWDADYRMFLACFTILGQFVEEELGPANDDEDAYRGYRLHSVDGGEPKAIDLWLWYRDELPKLIAEYNQDIQECYTGEWKTEPVEGLPGYQRIVDFGEVREPKFPHDYPEIVKDQKLKELMEIRRTLWT